MTPNEIADWLDALVVDEVDYEERIIHKAAATIRELEAQVAKHIASHKETIERERVALNKLKIATEALEPIVDEFESTIEQYNRNGPHWTSADGEMFDVGVVMDREPLIEAGCQALARIKGVVR